MNSSHRRTRNPNGAGRRRRGEAAYDNHTVFRTRIPNEYADRIDAMPGSRYANARRLIIEGLKAVEAQNQTPKH
ncbi:MAG: hypothetical protein AAGE59_32125 [Cyanobacteria bacterium P01_F01_bin.86]